MGSDNDGIESADGQVMMRFSSEDEEAGPSSQQTLPGGHQGNGEQSTTASPKARTSSGYFGVCEDDNRTNTQDSWKLYMTLPITTALQQPGEYLPSALTKILG